MCQTPNTAIAVIGIDMVPRRRRQCTRRHRAAGKSGRVAKWKCGPPTHLCLIGMEAWSVHIT